jgi:preprotein translocase subunit SecG
MQSAFQIASIIVSLALIAMILLQVKGGGLSSMLGGDSGGGIARTRRGLEKTMFQITVGLSVAFLIICIMSAVTSQS